MKKYIFLFFSFVALSIATISAKTVYLNTGGASLWEMDGAKFAIWYWGTGSAGAWTPWMSHVEGPVWSANIPDGNNNLIFVRLSGDAASPNWDAKWNQTADLSLPSMSAPMYTIVAWGENGLSTGSWSNYGDEPGPNPYSSSVPAQCPDVMLQAFFWDSNDPTKPDSKTYGDTRWSTLLASSGEIGAYFDLVWLPPSSKSTGGVGYGPLQYSNQNSDWGTRQQLEQLISNLHAQGARVVADIVVNHIANQSTWCDFYDLDFDEQGTYQPTSSWICRTDEMNYDAQAGDCKGKATGANDDGYGDEANYAAARDWDHCNAMVRNMCKSYLTWLVETIGYDGFRYDYCKGFHNSHIAEYNSAAKAYFSVMEYWDGNPSVLQQHLADANWNTLTFDFATKYSVFNQGIASGNYSGCRGSGLLGAGKAKYAVTFIDNHDTFHRDDNEFCGNGNSMSHKDKLLQCNAFILSMPGIPCVFYPHWKDATMHNPIRKMIAARHIVGVHSESPVANESCDASGYQCTVQGKNGYLVLQLGNRSGQSISGFTKFVSGSGYCIWIQPSQTPAPKVIINTPSQVFHTATLSVQLSATESTEIVSIYYTTDGTTPTTSSTRYTSPFTISTTTTVKAIAVAGTQSSSVQEATYTYRAPQTTPIRVRFLQPSEEGWNQVCLYAWTPTGEVLTPGWPGQVLTVDAEGWYSYQFDADVQQVNFIFNNANHGQQTHDLYTEEDVCYYWKFGGEYLDADCSASLEGLRLVVSPMDATFRDAVAGISVSLTAIGAEDATIYYTTDGSTPTRSSSSAVGTTTLTFHETTTLRAFAATDSIQTDIIKSVYTYKAPQTTAIVVRFRNSANWSKVNLYSWSTTADQKQYTGAWPGTALTQDDEGWYSYQFPVDVKEVNLIFNNGSVQSNDLYTDEDACYYWDAALDDAVLDPKCVMTPLSDVRTSTDAIDWSQPVYDLLGRVVGRDYRGIVVQSGRRFLL